jgi:hypothetical protein
MSGDWQIIDITPEPTPEELDAIVAALAILAGSEYQLVGQRSRWREIAKHESMREFQTEHWRRGRMARWNHGLERANSVSRSGSSRPDR